MKTRKKKLSIEGPERTGGFPLKFHLQRILTDKFLISLIYLIFLSINPASAEDTAAPVVVITIDAETVDHEKVNISLPDQFNLDIDGVSCGINKIMEICDKHKMKATFFLDVYEYKKFGEEAIRRIAQEIDKKGFDVQLHTHPQWAYDKKRVYMFEYSLKEQIQIIKDGKELLERWIGKEPVVHRAGAYSANEDTLKALYENNIFYDSSFFYAYPTSMLQKAGLKMNFAAVSNGVYQFPVNVILLERYNSSLNFIEPVRSIVKYDINSMNYEILTSAVDKGMDAGFDTIVLFLHSFSFIKQYTEEGKEPNISKIEQFDDILTYLEEKKLAVLPFNKIIEDLENGIGEVNLTQPDSLPIVKIEINPAILAAKKLGVNKRNAVMVTTGGAVSAVSLFVIVYLVIRVKRK